MDRKRKSRTDNDTPTSKRQKLQPETPASTASVQQIGLQLIQTLRNAKDKTGRDITTLFLSLPDRRDLPEYFQEIKLPIAIDTVEKKLKSNGYSSLTEVESDFKRMVSNAKQFNDDKSLVFADAERVRKLLSNWMKVHNPAYQDPEYAAFPTPIPGEDAPTNGASQATGTRDNSERPKKPTINLSRSRRQSPPPEPAEPEPSTEAGDFAGKTFQEAQEQIIQELIDFMDDEGFVIFDPFRNLPSRTLVDYYQLIKRPVSLSGVKKRVLGKHGREPPTGISDFKSWDSFEDEVSFIWKNAREYNEDGSEMYDLAGEFEEHFKRRLGVAKAAVEGPSGPKLKLNARPKPMLHLGAKASPTPASTSGVSVDGEALSRQKQMVQAGVNGQQTPQASQSRSASQVPGFTDKLTTSTTAPEIKMEGVLASPAPASIKLASIAPDTKQSSQPPSTMPPPARLPSASPHPAALPITTRVPIYTPAPVTFLDNFSRNKSVSEALLPNLQISTHPQLNAQKPFRIDIGASPDFTYQSTTVMLPASQYYIQITPVVSAALSSGRQYKLFVTLNGVRLNPSTKPAMNGDMIGALERKQVYDAPLHPGVNRIEVDIAAVTGRGGTLDIEKISVFANLMRN